MLPLIQEQVQIGTSGVRFGSVRILECENGYARVLAQVPDPPAGIEPSEQVFLRTVGGSWKVIASGSGLSCEDEGVLPQLDQACRALGHSPAAARAHNEVAPTGQRFLPSVGCWMPPEKALQQAVRAHVPGPENDVNICQRRNRNTASASLDVNLEDDSIAEERHQLQLRRYGGRWMVVQDDHLQRCQQGRGHRDFSKELCI